SWGEMSGIQVDLEGGREIERKNTFWTKIEAEIEPIKDWKIYGDYGWNTINSQKTLQRNTQETLGPTGVLYPHYDTPAVSYFDRRNGFDRYWRYNLYSSYEKIISDHGFKLLVGHQREYGSIESLYGNV